MLLRGFSLTEKIGRSHSTLQWTTKCDIFSEFQKGCDKNGGMKSLGKEGRFNPFGMRTITIAFKQPVRKHEPVYRVVN